MQNPIRDDIEAKIEVSAAALERAAGRLSLHFGGVPWGYAWVFPKAQHLSVGVATFQTPAAANLRALLTRFCRKSVSPGSRPART